MQNTYANLDGFHWGNHICYLYFPYQILMYSHQNYICWLNCGIFVIKIITVLYDMMYIPSSISVFLQKLVEQFLQKASTTKALRKDVIVGRENKVQIVRRDDRGGIPVDTTPSHNHYYLLLYPNQGEMTGLPFNVTEYLSHLRTKTLGHTVIYSPVISSTQSLFTGYKLTVLYSENLVVG